MEARLGSVETGLRNLNDRVGEPPNPITGAPGSGLSGLVTQLVAEKKRSVVGASALGAGGVTALLYAAIEVWSWVSRLLHL